MTEPSIDVKVFELKFFAHGFDDAENMGNNSPLDKVDFERTIYLGYAVWLHKTKRSDILNAEHVGVFVRNPLHSG